MDSLASAGLLRLTLWDNKQSIMRVKKTMALIFSMVTLNVSAQQISADKIYEELIRQEVAHPYVTLQIATLETGRGKTARNNNLFGFRGKNGYMKFKNWQAAVTRYKQWQEKYYPKHLATKHSNGTECDYYCFLLSKGYNSGRSHSSQERQYVSKLKKMRIKNYDNIITGDGNYASALSKP
jgi:hypothetical protein